MESATETERKYDVPADFELPPLSGVGGVSRASDAETHDLDATYFDTEDLRLARHRHTLRRRTGGSDDGWHLKTPGDGATRTEHRLPLDAGTDEVPGPLKAQVRAIVRDRALRPVARLRTLRRETPLCDDDGHTLALVAEDTVTAETDAGRQSWHELEVELVDGGKKVLTAVERALLAAGATPADGPSKLARALGDQLPAPATDGDGQPDPVLAYARAQRDALEAYDPGVRRGEPEAVHKMRVATRRLRSTLRTFKAWFPPQTAGPVTDELKWLADLLGTVRDAQVQSHKLLATVDRDGPEFAGVGQRIRAHLDDAETRGRAALTEALDGERYLRLLDVLDALVDAPVGTGRDAKRRVRKALHKADGLLDQAHADGVDAELHDARKAYKRARYAVEVLAPGAGKTGAKLVDKLTDLQDVLGSHQDSVVARELLRELAGAARAAGEDGFPYGVLHARQERVGDDTLAELPAAEAASRRAKLRGWLD
ncbi:CHAD domain-containing protein [Krasilnikovia sp. MM14-A1004]|uniref:CYTH and CHAD domain-containing protein n=1 Tax=Krasilnikovia sp. MM14-A1004 TaxID=3373541 RepID=UPI00399C5F00